MLVNINMTESKECPNTKLICLYTCTFSVLFVNYNSLFSANSHAHCSESTSSLLCFNNIKLHFALNNWAVFFMAWQRRMNKQQWTARKGKAVITCNIINCVEFNSYSASHDNWCTATLWNSIMTVQCEGMGEARYEPALLPPCPSIRALSCSNCQRSTHSNIQAWQCKC